LFSNEENHLSADMTEILFKNKTENILLKMLFNFISYC